MIARLLFLLVIGLSVLVLDGCATSQAGRVASKKKAKKKKPRPAQDAPPAMEEDEDEEQDLNEEEDDEDLAAVIMSEGGASFYHHSLAGRPTASGEKYNPEAQTCAHKTLPFDTVLLIEDVNTGKKARCRVNDRGPYVGGRIIDLSKRVARELGILDKGVAKVRIRISRPPSS